MLFLVPLVCRWKQEIVHTLKHSATRILCLLSRLSSRHTCTITTSKLSFAQLCLPPPPNSGVCVRACVHVCMRVCVRVCLCAVSVIVKCLVLLPCVTDGRYKNPLYYYYLKNINQRTGLEIPTAPMVHDH